MSQDNRAPLACKTCDKVNYQSHRNKKMLKERLTLSKFCKQCRAHTEHKETK